MDKRKNLSKSIIKLLEKLYKIIPENPNYEVKSSMFSVLSKNSIQKLKTTKKNLETELNNLDSDAKILEKRIFYAQLHGLKNTLKHLRGDLDPVPNSPTYMTTKPMFGGGVVDTFKNMFENINPTKTKLINEIMATRKLLRITIPEHPEYSRVCECEYKESLEKMSLEKLNKAHATFSNALKNLDNDPLNILQTRITVMSPALNKLKRDLTTQTNHLKSLQDTYQNKIKETQERLMKLQTKTPVQIFNPPKLTRAQTLKVNKDLKKKVNKDLKKKVNKDLKKKSSSLGSLNKTKSSKPIIKRSVSIKSIKPIEKKLDIQALNEEFNKILAL